MPMASLAQLEEHALRKRMVMGSIPIGGFFLLLCPSCLPDSLRKRLSADSVSTSLGLLA